MGILNWLRSLGTPWLGPTASRHTAAEAELTDEKVRARMAGLAGRVWFLPYQDSITGETEGMRRAYRLMLRDPNVKAALLDKILSVAALDTSVNPGDEDPRDEIGSEFGTHLLKRMRGGMRGLVESVILPGLMDGYSITEKLWRVEDKSRKWNGKLILDLKSKDPNNLQLEVDEFNNVVSIVGRSYNMGETFDPANFILWRHLSIFDNPGGMSDLRAAYRAYWLIDTSWKLRGIHLEKFTSPMLKGTYTDGSQKDGLESALEKAKSSTWISIPTGVLVEAMELSQKGASDYKAAIDDLKHEVFLGISGAILQALEGSTTEGRGSSAIHKSTADIRKWHIKSCVEDVVNDQIFPDAIDLNFAGVAYPVLTLGGIDDNEMTQSLAVDVGLNRDLRLKLSRKDLYKRYGRPEPTEPEDTLEPAEPAAPTPGGFFADRRAAKGGLFAEVPADPAALAATTAATWNATESAGGTVSNSDIEDVSSKLEGTGWIIYWDASTNQWASASVGDFNFTAPTATVNGAA